MTTDRELMQQALDALEGYARNCRCEGGGAPCDAAEALRARLAEPEPEVRWDASAPLVVHPHPAFQTTEPQREWQGLTDEEMRKTVDGYFEFDGGDMWGSYRAIESKLKAKNAL